ncbi:MAG: acetyltransferase [Fidelibacterota bacterium]
MLIVGSKGLGREVLASMHQHDPHEKYYFFDNIDKDVEDKIFGKFKVYRTFEEVMNHFEHFGRNFITARGNPLKRYRINRKFISLGGVLTSVISKQATVGSLSSYGDGVIIQPESIVSSNVKLGEGCFLNCASIVAHDVTIGKYTTIQPGAKVLGNATIGEFCLISTDCVIMPHVRIGNRVRIGVNVVIDHDISDGEKIG